MSNKIVIPRSPLNSRKMHLTKEIEEIKKILDKIEKEINGQEIAENCRQLILRGFKMANGNLSGVLSFKKISDLDKRK